MGTEDLLLVIYGLVLIASFFMMCSCGRLAVDEAKYLDWRDLRHSTYFIITGCLVLASVALIGISAIRVVDGLAGVPIAGRWPKTFTLCMILLGAAKAGFHWAATLTKPRWQWRLFVLFSIFWLIVSFPLVLFR